MIRIFASLLALVLAGPCLAAGTPVYGPGTVNNAGPGYISANWYQPSPVVTAYAGSPVNAGNGEVVCYWGRVNQTVTITSLGVPVTTGAGSTNVQLAIYNNGSWGRPSTLIDSTASIATTSSTAFVSAALGGAQKIGPAGYWFCFNQDNTSAVLKSAAATYSSQADTAGSTSGSSTSGIGVILGIKIAQAYNTWPTFDNTTVWVDATTAIVPPISFKVQ